MHPAHVGAVVTRRPTPGSSRRNANPGEKCCVHAGEIAFARNAPSVLGKL